MSNPCQNELVTLPSLDRNGLESITNPKLCIKQFLLNPQSIHSGPTRPETQIGITD